MISSIGSLPNFDSQSSYQTAPVTQNTAQSQSSQYASSQTSQPAQDVIQLSAAGLAALQTPEEIFLAANSGNAQAIAIIEQSQSTLLTEQQ
jgi:hypothetical protein